MENKTLTEENKIWLIETLLKSTSYEEFQEKANNFFKVTEKEVETTLTTIDTPKEVVAMSTPSVELQKEEQLFQMTEEDRKRASIYASEHRSIAMEENNIGTSKGNTLHEDKAPVSTPIIEHEEEVSIFIPDEEPKTRVLEPSNSNGRKITYENIQVVLPGQLKL